MKQTKQRIPFTYPFNQISFFLCALIRIKAQPRFPNFTKNHAVLFLHACYWDKAATQKAFQRYATIRAGAPDVFSERDPTSKAIQNVFGLW